MTVYAMLTVDLNQVTDTARQAFYKYLTDNRWTRLKLTTTFTARFKPQYTAEKVLLLIEKRVQDAANAASIKNYEAAVQVGEVPLKKWMQPMRSPLRGL